jgi:hypothetical protein
MSKMDTFTDKNNSFWRLIYCLVRNDFKWFKILIWMDFLKIKSQIKSSYFKTI